MNPKLSFSFLANLVPQDKKIAIIIDHLQASEMITRLARVGIQNCEGFLEI